MMSKNARSVTLLAAADQAVSSLTNIVVTVVAARNLSVAQFGAFSLAFAIYVFVAGAFQSFIGQTIVLKTNPSQYFLGAARVAVVGSLLAGACIFSVAISIAHSELQNALAAVSLLLPLLVLQDTLRFFYASVQKPQLALASDLLWFLVAISTATLLVPSFADGGSAVTYLLVWGLGAVPALLPSLFLRRLGGQLTQRLSLHTMRRGYLGHRFGIEFLAIQGGAQIPILLFGFLGDVISAAALRAASTVFGPLNVAFNAAQNFAVPIVKQLRVEVQTRVCLYGSCIISIASLFLGLTLLFSPARFGTALFGESWQYARDLLVAFSVQYAALSFVYGGRILLRIKSPKATLPIQIATSVIAFCSSILGYLMSGAEGLAWGLAAASWFQAMSLWTYALKSTWFKRKKDDGRTFVQLTVREQGTKRGLER